MITELRTWRLACDQCGAFVDQTLPAAWPAGAVARDDWTETTTYCDNPACTGHARHQCPACAAAAGTQDQKEQMP